MNDSYRADLVDLLRCLSAWLAAEEEQLQPLLDRHDYDIDRLRSSLDLHAALLSTETDEMDF